MKHALRVSVCCLWTLLQAAAPGVTFVDVAEKAGITPKIVAGSPDKTYVLEVNGSGACWFDYDGDGYVDLYLVNGSTLEQLQGKTKQRTRNYLYRNNGNGTFSDVTEAARVPGRGWGFGCVTADYDNDGHADLFLANYGANVLYRNNGDGTFADVTQRAGVGGGDIWHAGAAFGDYDGNGYLDLYVSGYLDFNAMAPEVKTCEYRGVMVKACGPLGYKGAPDALYRNNGDGTFTDVTRKAGVEDRGLHFGFTVIFDDFNDDGRADIFVANDSNPNYLYINKGDGTFEETGVASGAALSGDGKEMSSMGVAAGDYDNDGLPDLFITTFADDNYVLFHNDGDGFFTDVSYPSGVGEPTVPYLGWATFFVDYDHDGWKDLFIVNGHVYPEVDGKLRETYRQPLQMLRNLGEGKFAEVSAEVGFGNIPHRSGRGGAYADYDNDGDIDAVVSNIDDRPQLLENRGGNKANWLQLVLEGTKSNRDAIGAKVKITAGDLVQYDHVRAGGSFLSGNDRRLHFGLGKHAAADLIEIRWPSGKLDRFENVKANRILAIREGGGLQVSKYLPFK